MFERVLFYRLAIDGKKHVQMSTICLASPQRPEFERTFFYQLVFDGKKHVKKSQKLSRFSGKSQKSWRAIVHEPKSKMIRFATVSTEFDAFSKKIT